MQRNTEQAQNIIKEADAILITAGAGMGVDSGLPDFRGNEGFWEAYPPIRKLGLSFAQMANPQWFDSDPRLAWAFYGHRLNLYRETIPHDGFKMLLELAKQKNDNYFIYTSNVDGQFQKAGFDSDKIVEVHGSIHHFQCSDGCSGDIWSAKDEVVEVDMDSFQALNTPRCIHCNALARPNILMFGDWAWSGHRTSAQEDRFGTWLAQNSDKKIAILEIGAGTAVPTIRMEGEFLSQKQPNIRLIRINPRDYHLGKGVGVAIALGGLAGIKAIS
ncbi:MAG: Sir2 family NAD-dependent protein deacetylase [Campylobacterota bacterium]|nr:Sir2 family NAD-dependent protein deacetylase [Campylobacterota bacterium]